MKYLYYFIVCIILNGIISLPLSAALVAQCSDKNYYVCCCEVGWNYIPSNVDPRSITLATAQPICTSDEGAGYCAGSTNCNAGGDGIDVPAPGSNLTSESSCGGTQII